MISTELPHPPLPVPGPAPGASLGATPGTIPGASERRGRREARAVGSFIAGLTRKAFAKYGFALAGLLTDWEAIAGGDIACYTRPERLRWPRASTSEDDAEEPRRGATLVLRVEGARGIDVQFRARQIIERINAYFGYAAVGELRIVQGPVGIADGGGGLHRDRRGAGEKDHACELARQEDLAGIADAALRQALLRLLAGIRMREPQRRLRGDALPP